MQEGQIVGREFVADDAADRHHRWRRLLRPFLGLHNRDQSVSATNLKKRVAAAESAMRTNMSAIDILRSGAEWTDRTTRVALPIVLASAVDGAPITYGDLNLAVHTRGEPLKMALTYRYVAGKIGDVCEALARDLGYDVPPLNAIIVNEKSGLPSYGVDNYLATYSNMTPRQIKRLRADERDSYARTAMEKVFNFTGWDRVRRHLGITKAQTGKPDRNRGEPIPPPNRLKFSDRPGVRTASGPQDLACSAS